MLVREFAELLSPALGNNAALLKWITNVPAAGLPYLHAFADGLEPDRSADDAGLGAPPGYARSAPVRH